jgi:hypothetical protein
MSFMAGEGDCPSALSRAPECGVHRSEAKTLDRRSGRIRRSLAAGRATGKKTVPLGTCRGQLWFCECATTGVEEVLQEKGFYFKNGGVPEAEKEEIFSIPFQRMVGSSI